MINPEDHLKLVYKVVKSLNLKKEGLMECEDIVGYGMIGLMLAVKRFDESKGNEFSTFAIPTIYRTILSSITRYSGRIGTIKMKVDGTALIPIAVDDFNQILYKDKSNTFENDILFQVYFEELLGNFKESYQFILREYFINNKSINNIAEQLNVTPSNVAIQLRICKKRLAVLLERDSKYTI